MTPSDARTRSDPAAPAAAWRAPALRPPALRPGDQVAVLSVSSPADPAQLAIGLDALRFAGLDPVLYPSAHDLVTRAQRRGAQRRGAPSRGRRGGVRSRAGIRWCHPVLAPVLAGLAAGFLWETLQTWHRSTPRPTPSSVTG